MSARMEYRDTNKKDAGKQKAWKEAVINYKAAQEQLKTTREGYYRCDTESFTLRSRTDTLHAAGLLQGLLPMASQLQGDGARQLSWTAP